MKKVKVFLAATVLFGTLVVNPSLSLASETVLEDSSISSFKPIIEWRYKVMNGYVYKRQFNHSTLKWLGQWVKA